MLFVEAKKTMKRKEVEEISNVESNLPPLPRYEA